MTITGLIVVSYTDKKIYILYPQCFILTSQSSIINSPSAKFPHQPPTINCDKSTWFFTRNVLKVAGFSTKCLQALLPPLESFSTSDCRDLASDGITGGELVPAAPLGWYFMNKLSRGLKIPHRKEMVIKKSTLNISIPGTPGHFCPV